VRRVIVVARKRVLAGKLKDNDIGFSLDQRGT